MKNQLITVLTLFISLYFVACGAPTENQENAEDTTSETMVEETTPPETEEVVHTVRAQVVNSLSEEQTLTVDHENIEGYMNAMRMTLRVADPDEAEGLAQGDIIQFEMVKKDQAFTMRNIEKLPADTKLELSTMKNMDTMKMNQE
ncbi:MAG: copper-binding protein [Bacteroidia bacterium]|nr:copper-binding protein [Bacteroidia bacterium]